MANSQTPSSKRPRRGPQSFNPFENLPLDMFENILSFLPIKEATQKCCTIGSSRFKNSMNLNRKFMFGRDFALQYTKDYVAELVNRLFDTHRGKDIQTFELCIDPIGIENLLNKWLNICIQKGIEDLELYLMQSGYTVSADIINGLKKLRTLKVVYCEFELPSKLQSMVNLKSIVLWHVSLTEDKLETLVYHCRVLGTIDLVNCIGIRYVRIGASEHRYLKVLRIAGLKDLEAVAVNSPTLESLHYSGYVIRITFYRTPQLKDAFINFEAAGSRRYLHASDVEKLVTAIPNVTVLTASALVPEALTTRFRHGVYGEASYGFMNMKELQLIMEGALFCNPYDVVMFMKRCPMLEIVFIDMSDYNFDCGPYWELHQKPKLERFDQNFEKLRFIKLKGFKFLQSELQLVKILLKKATNLEALILVTPKNGRTKLLYRTDAARYNHFLFSWRASPETKIVLFEHMSDNSGVNPQHTKDWYY